MSRLSELPIRIATTDGPERYHHYQCVLEDPEIQWLGQIAGPFTDEVMDDVDALVVSCEYPLQTRLAIAACKLRGIPTFHVIDGILEWRNLFENPRSNTLEAGAPLFQPLLADYTFVMGERQKETLDWLGNQSVFVTGLPRLDSMAAIPRPTKLANSGRLLVATARTPWLDSDQEVIFCAAFSKLVTELSATPLVSAIHWRVAPKLAELQSLPSSDESPLHNVLAEVDAVITSPSTLMIEAMMLGKPVMIFDPYRRPQLNTSVWYAGSSADVMDRLGSLLAPSSESSSFQDLLLSQLTLTDGKAGERVVRFIKAIVNTGLGPADYASSKGLCPVTYSPSEQWWDMSKAEISALLKTIPALEQHLSEQSNKLKDMHDAHNRRFAVRLKGLIRKLTRSKPDDR